MGPQVTPKHADLRRVVSDKRAPREQTEINRRSATLSNSNRSSNSSLNESVESLNRHSPSPPVKKPQRVSARKSPVLSQGERKSDSLPRRSGSNELKAEGSKPALPAKPALLAKPTLPAKPPKPPVKPQRLIPGDKKKVPLVSLVNGSSCDNVNDTETQTPAEVTSETNNMTSQQVRPRVPPARPSPDTRVSRHKPSGTKLLEMIEQKLDQEGIDLVQEPYSGQVGY